MKLFFHAVLAAAVVFPSAISLAADAPQTDTEALRNALSKTLKDADSAKIENVRYAAKGGEHPSWDVCGDVNAKNSYGAYTGFSPFFGLAFPKPNDGGLTYVIITANAEVASVMCAKSGL